MTAREADVHTRRGFELAGRGAYFSARAELIMALRLLAQALDAGSQTTTHSRALASGLTAIREAADFLPGGTQLEAHLDMRGVIAAHESPVLKNDAVEGLTPLIALQSYFTYAQEQLSAAGDGEWAASMALYGLGNLHRTLAAERIGVIRAAAPKATTFYHASLLVSPRNYLASNELGVLLARAGRYHDARSALEHSVSVCPQSAGWHNLAVVHRQLGEADRAQGAYRQYQASRRIEIARALRPGPVRGHQVQWVDPGVLAGSHGRTPYGREPQVPAPSPVPSIARRIAPWLFESSPGQTRGR
jgi:tetratricopeptide (TPR) repeat protein